MASRSGLRGSAPWHPFPRWSRSTMNSNQALSSTAGVASISNSPYSSRCRTFQARALESRRKLRVQRPPPSRPPTSSTPRCRRRTTTASLNASGLAIPGKPGGVGCEALGALHPRVVIVTCRRSQRGAVTPSVSARRYCFESSQSVGVGGRTPTTAPYQA